MGKWAKGPTEGAKEAKGGKGANGAIGKLGFCKTKKVKP
jgi:hypothetical protein